MDRVARALAWPQRVRRASPAEVVRAWGRLGYPRRALRLRDAAAACVERHGGQVPEALAELRALPGVGRYTAAAVAAFGFGQRVAVVDTNVARVHARAVRGVDDPRPPGARAQRELAALLPATAAPRWSVAVMELGALVCRARSPRCGTCPLASRCAWRADGAPAWTGPIPAAQPFAGTDRQVRGRLLDKLRRADGAAKTADLAAVWVDDLQRERALTSLITDGLVVPVDGGYSLPG